MKKILFIGSYADNEYLDSVKLVKCYVQYAANRVESYYINGLEINQGHSIDVLSGLVTIPFKKSNVIHLNSHTSQTNGNGTISNVGFWNFRYSSIIEQSIKIKKEAKKWLQVQVNSPDTEDIIVFVYSMRVPYLKAACELKKEYSKIKIVNIVPDLPQYMRLNRNMLQRLLQKINEKKLSEYQKSIDGFVLYAKTMQKPLGLNEDNSIVIEGIIDEKQIKLSNVKNKKNNKKKYTYTGGISKEYGSELLLKAFIKADLPSTELLFYGDGNYVSELKEIARDNPRIKYMGRVSPSDSFIAMQESDLLINPRPSNNIFTKYSCPSKVLEYMASGTPALITRLDGIPNDYYKYVYTIEDETVDGLAETLSNINKLSPQELKCKGNKARAYIIKEKTSDNQINKIFSMIERL